jgi:hypothetical protein
LSAAAGSSGVLSASSTYVLIDGWTGIRIASTRTFERAIVALDKALDALAVRRDLRPPGEEDGEGDEKGEKA